MGEFDNRFDGRSDGRPDNRNRGEQHYDVDRFSRVVKAGKRTYFLDVKSTRDEDYYLTITESKRHVDDTGRFTYEKHKIFLYKEDFAKFVDGVQECVEYVRAHVPEIVPRAEMESTTRTDDIGGYVENAGMEPDVF
jgi:hypothetical protein